MSVLFIAGAGTDIGKTYVTALLIRQLRDAHRPVQALKPVASGVAALDDPAFASSDTAVLLDAMGLPLEVSTVAACTPWRFAAPLSPDMAAVAEGRSLKLADIQAWCRQRIVHAPSRMVTLIEGVGGVMSPVAEDALNLDWIKALGCPVVLVGGTYLGAISHTLTALATLRAHRAPVSAIVLNETQGSPVDFDATLKSLTRFGGDVAVWPLRQRARSLPVDLLPA